MNEEWVRQLDARQRAMLAEMGVKVWAPKARATAVADVAPAAVAEPAPLPTHTPVAAPAPRVSTAQVNAPASAPASETTEAATSPLSPLLIENLRQHHRGPPAPRSSGSLAPP